MPKPMTKQEDTWEGPPFRISMKKFKEELTPLSKAAEGGHYVSRRVYNPATKESSMGELIPMSRKGKELIIKRIREMMHPSCRKKESTCVVCYKLYDVISFLEEEIK